MRRRLVPGRECGPRAGPWGDDTAGKWKETEIAGLKVLTGNGFGFEK
jgi:hypothetical protein